MFTHQCAVTLTLEGATEVTVTSRHRPRRQHRQFRTTPVLTSGWWTDLTS